MADIEINTRPLLDKDTFIDKIIAVGKQRGNVLQTTLIKAYADERCEGGYSDDLVRAIRHKAMKSGVFIDDDLSLSVNQNNNMNESYHEDVRHYTNKLLELLDNQSVEAKWLATSLMDYLSEDEVADFANYNDYFDVEEINSPYDVRQATNHFIELFDEGALDPADIVRNLVLYMSEDNVKEFCHDYELCEDEEELDESVKIITETIDRLPLDAVEKVLLALNPLITDSNIVFSEDVSTAVEKYLTDNGISEELKDDLEAKVVDKLVATDILVTDEEIHECGLCGEKFPKSDLYREKDFKWLCDGCYNELRSRGEKIDLEDEYNRPLD